jgi:hypothetical protein
VQLDTGDEVLCRSLKRLHRPLGFYAVPYCGRAKISYTKGSDNNPYSLKSLRIDAAPASRIGAWMNFHAFHSPRKPFQFGLIDLCGIVFWAATVLAA